jgi:hypothetical protein
MLLALPLPALMSLQTPWRTKLRLYSLCSLGIFIIAITIIRLPINAINATVQANRTTWASTELLAAAIVVNAPILYGSINRWRHQRHGNSRTLTSRTGVSLAIHALGSSDRARQPHSMISELSDDDRWMLGKHCRAPTTPESLAQEHQCQDGIILRTIQVSYHGAASVHTDGSDCFDETRN